MQKAHPCITALYNVYLHVHLSANVFTVFIQPRVEWASTEQSLSYQGHTVEEKTAQKILEFVRDETNIDFKFVDSQCHGETFVARGLAGVVEVIETLISKGTCKCTCNDRYAIKQITQL